MYPLIRLAKVLIVNRKAPALNILDTHVADHRCWPQDIDLYREMNNGRILTILELGRIAFSVRTGLDKVMRRKKWGFTIAGCSVRYRKRIRPFVKFRVVSKVAGWDHRFMYIENSIWIGEDCAVQALFRSAVVSSRGMVEPSEVLAAMGHSEKTPSLPDWVQNWIDADATRPWPPEVKG